MSEDENSFDPDPPEDKDQDYEASIDDMLSEALPDKEDES